jgi:hypothetical protein
LFVRKRRPARSGTTVRDDLRAKIAGFALRLQQLDGYIIERDPGICAGNMREAAAGVADLSVRHYEMGFGFSGDGVDDVSGA